MLDSQGQIMALALRSRSPKPFKVFPLHSAAGRVLDFTYLERHVLGRRQIGILLPNNQRQHCTLHIQKDVLPYALCSLLCPVSAGLASISRMDSVSTSYILDCS